MARLHVMYEAYIDTDGAVDADDIRRDIAAALEPHGTTTQLLWQFNLTEEGVGT